MPSRITVEYDQSISAFTAENKLTMNAGHPVVFWSFRIKDLQEWLVTLEETMLKDDNVANRIVMERLYFSLKAAHNKHRAEHDAVVTDAPNGDDLMAYLTAYAAATAAGL